ncbi:MAG: lytic transglycosylase domain-containing protein [Pseudomonadota bacterium]
MQERLLNNKRAADHERQHNPARRAFTAIALAMLLCLGAAPVQAQIYKWTDENGIVHFSSQPPKDDSAFERFRFPCYASDSRCSARVNWETVPLNRTAYPDIIRDVAVLHRIDEGLIRAVIHAESAYQVDAKSPKGAQGLMQLMPTTQADLGVANPYDPIDNIEAGTRYLAQLLDQFDGDITLASAAYNAGPGAVERHGGVPPYAETREYVRRVAILHRRYSSAN